MVARADCMQAAFNLLVCSYALGDKEGMMGAFQRMLTIPGLADSETDDEDIGIEDDEDVAAAAAEAGLRDSLLTLKSKFRDGLRDEGLATDQMKQEQRQQLANVKR